MWQQRRHIYRELYWLETAIDDWSSPTTDPGGPPSNCGGLEKPIVAVELEFYVTRRSLDNNRFKLVTLPGLSADLEKSMTFGFDKDGHARTIHR